MIERASKRQKMKTKVWRANNGSNRVGLSRFAFSVQWIASSHECNGDGEKLHSTFNILKLGPFKSLTCNLDKYSLHLFCSDFISCSEKTVWVPLKFREIMDKLEVTFKSSLQQYRHTQSRVILIGWQVSIEIISRGTSNVVQTILGDLRKLPENLPETSTFQQEKLLLKHLFIFQ